MKIGLDLHGVIAKEPEFFSDLSRMFIANGHEVHIITGSLYSNDLETRLGNYGMVWTKIHSISSHLRDIGAEVEIDEKGNPWIEESLWDSAKSIYCLENSIDFHIDDSDIYGKYFKTCYCRFYNNKFEWIGPKGQGGFPLRSPRDQYLDITYACGVCNDNDVDQECLNTSG